MKGEPLSRYQHREWVLWRMADGRSDRVVAAARRLADRVDTSEVEKRLKNALARHPALRLTFDAQEPCASIAPDATVPLAVRYARPDDDLAAAVAEFTKQAAGAPFSLSAVPAMRAVLVRAGDGETQQSALLIVAHPIIADEISLERLLAEIDAGEAPEAVDQAFFDWTAALLLPERQEAEKEKISIYRQILNGARFQIDLPTDRARPPVFNPEGDSVEVPIPEQVRDGIEKFAAAEKSRPATVVIAALVGYLGRITRQQDLVLGLATDLRPAGGEAFVGPFENTAVLKVGLEQNLTGHGLITRVRDSLTALAPLYDVPFQALVEALRVERDPSRTPIYQVCFAHRCRQDEQAWLPAPTGRVSSDLDVVFEQRRGSMLLRLGFRKDLFRRETITHMAGHLVELLAALCDRPEEPLSSLSLCTPKERAWVLSTLGVQRNFPSEHTIHGLVAAAAAKNPNATALSFGKMRLSYGELNRRANQLAHRLRGLGVGRDVGVGVCMERSEELIIALLAILKAGGYYVPIEPANPIERIEFVLTDSKVHLLLTEPAQMDKLAATALHTIVIEKGGERFAAEPVTDPQEVSASDALAYVIYTSGSTGRPKGVLIEHRNVVRLFTATQDWFHFDEHDVWTMFHSAAFDFSVWEIWGALIYGGRVVVVPYLVSRSPVDFYQLLAVERVTVLNQTPSAFRQLIQAEMECGQRDLALRLVIFGGEALEFESLRPWFERHGDRYPRLVNMYGITETCVHVTYRPVTMADLDAGQGASIIGIPIPDLSAYVVDEKLQLLPPGVPGELVVGGAGLARGYHDRPELTAERFVPDPYATAPGARLYRSGDFVRLLPTGELDYLGRIDLQVQIRGFRVETGEIEAVLRRSGLVQDVAVIPRQNRQGETLLVAYVVSERPPNELREAVRASLPEYMMPAHFVAIAAIPMTINGKVDRNALPAPQAGGEGTAGVFVAPADELERVIAGVWCDVLGADQVSTRESFFDIGGTSLGVVRVAAKLQNHLNRPINVVTLFQFPTVAALAKHLAQNNRSAAAADATVANNCPGGETDEPIAIVGMAGRFQNADDIEALWDMLVSGREGITYFEDQDLDSTLDRAVVADPAYVKARGILSGAALFDAAFFGINPREAEVTDPQQRVLMELAWEALEHAGVDPSSFPGLIAAYVGVYNNTYYLENVLKRPDVIANVGAFQAMLGNEKDFVATRLAHRLDLKGPAVSIHTACSTSLVTVAHAFFALRTGQCDLALAGAAAVTCPQRSGYLYQEGGMLSPDGHTRPFDERANGTVFSDGAAVVVLRRLSEALAAGDTVYAVIRGAATNNDGGQRMSFSAPAVEGQAEVVSRALTAAKIHPESISYVEAHGTATPLGDPIEVAGLKQAFGGNGKKTAYCGLGSIKSNLGHLTAAAGTAGLIKTALSLCRGQIPPSLNFSRPNPQINFNGSPFYVVAQLQPWPRQAGRPRRAGVSSFGVGGTNAHVVVEEAPEQPPGGPSRPSQLLVLSAKTDSALESMTANLAVHFKKHPELDLADVTFTLQTGRRPLSYRRALVASNVAEALERLSAPRSMITAKARAAQPPVVFLFPGQGAQYPEMGRELYEGEAVFRAAVDRCADVLEGRLGLDLLSVLYPNNSRPSDEASPINQTWLAQPAMFVVEYALAKLWMSWGVKPSVFIGHSIGEYVAAVLAEAFTLEAALELLCLRARLMQSLPPGAMLAVRAGAETIEPMLPAGVCVAAYNSPLLCVVSGPTEAVSDFQTELASKEIATRRLYTSHAFHSAMMEPMLAEFAVAAARLPAKPPKVPWVSTCTGRWMEGPDLADGQYWVRQVRRPVRFAQALEAVIGDVQNILLEVGPSQTLSQLARQHPKKPKDMTVVSSLGPLGEPGSDLASILSALGRLWVAGAGVDWKGFSGSENRRRVALPTYPFERKRYWLDPAPVDVSLAPSAIVQAPVLPSETQPIKEPELQVTPDTCTVVDPPRQERLINDLRSLFQSYSGTDHSQTDEKESFIDLGIDSLLLTQVSQGVLKRFGVKVTFRQMLGDLGSLQSLAAFLDEKLPPDKKAQAAAPAAPAAAAPAQAAAVAGQPAAPLQPLPVAANAGLLETVIQQQMAIMAQQLEALRQTGVGAAPCGQVQLAPARRVDGGPVITAVNLDQQSHFGPFKAIEKGAAGGITARQQAALDALVERYNRRTAKSKALSQEHRAHFCDPRAAGNFRQLWKEMVYPIMCAKSKGSRIWDIDGNEYIDVTMGFGANYLGHSPAYVMKALKKQMKQGMEIGPQSPIAGEVANLICEFTGMERATFCNTGSEAVMAAIRVSRTVTGREKIVYFYGDYHGIFDEVLGRPALVDGVPGAMPIAPGIPPLLNVVVLEYGSPSSLENIRNWADEIAAVIVEPVQSRHPDLQPRAFLQELRRLTAEKEIALIFDEVITGFRVAPGGAQEYFGVKADLATYGKVIGGGMPIGVLAGSATYMDALDGGFWQYGDDSSPPAGVTFFAGTFVRHPLTMAAARAVLQHLKSAGPSLQEQTNQRTARFVQEVNRFLQGRRLPMRLQHFSAIFYYDFHPDLKFASLLFYYLRDRGIHIWEGRVGTLSVAHSDQEMDQVLRAFQESVGEMQAGGFLPEADKKQGVPAAPSADGGKPESLHGEAGPPAGIQDPNRFPLAEAQREMWIGAQMRPEAAGPHHACTGLYLDGDLDVELMRQAIRMVVQRHEGLRCTFSEDGSEAVLHPDFLPEVPLHDLSTLSDAETDAQVDGILHQEARRILDLTTGPLVDFQLLRLNADRHLLVFTAQMIVCDGWSHYVVFEDLGLIYSALADGKEPVLPPAVPMRKYAQLQQANAGSDEVQACEAFWLSRFKTVPPPINLPTDNPRPPARTFEGDRCELTLSEDLYQGIKRLARKQKNSYFAVLLAVYYVWLNRLSGVRDLVVGVPFAAQGQLGMDALVGQCANILPLRVKIDPVQPFSNLLKGTWGSLLDAQENWDFSYGRVIEKIDLPRDPCRIPLVSVLFNIDPPMAKVHFNNLNHRFVAGPRCYFQYDIGFNLVEEEGTIRVECDYNRNLFDKQVVAHWVTGYQTLLEAVVEDPDCAVSRLPMVTEQQGFGLTGYDSLTADAGGNFADVYSLIAEQANRRPQAVAVSANGTSLTYGELGDRSKQLASRLRSLGVGPDVVVGICAGPSPHVLVGLLAIVRAGGAYALIDSDLTVEDLDHVLKDTGMPVILADAHSAARFTAATLRVVRLDEHGAGDTPDALTSPATAANAEHLACIAYQRGSNGGLEGAEITHGALANFLLAMGRELQLGDQDVFLCHSRLTGHSEAFELLLPLWLGARVVIASGASVLEPKALNNIIREDGITVMQATPSAWRLLLDAGWPGSRHFKALCRGEALHCDLADRLAERCAAAYTVFGAAETTFAAMVGRIRVGKPPVFERAVDNSRVVLVDPSLEPVPVGVPGEILVGGNCLARGYRNLLDLTKHHFRSRPVDGPNPCLLFHTGDMARYRPNGEIEFIGRQAQRVEIQNCSIDLGDVENVLRMHAAVQDTAVCLREDIGEQPGLVAYISLGNPGLAASENPRAPEAVVRELGRLVRRALPEYMRPVRAVVLTAVPREADGTIARARLPVPGKDDAGLEDHVDPRNQAEETLAGIWRELLDLQTVGIKDSFFDLGGKSLLAVRLFVRIEKAFGRKLPLATLFTAPTIEKLARLLAAGDDAPSKWPSLVPIQTQGFRPPLFLVHGAGGNVLLYSALAKQLEPDYPLYGLQSQGLDGQSEPLRTIEEMAEYYLEEVREVQRRGPYLLGGYCLGGTIAYEMAQRLKVIGEEVALVAMFDTYNFSRALKASFYSFLLQKLKFHWGNFISLGPKKMWHYLREKKRIASDGGWAHIRTEMPGSTLQDGAARAESGVEASVQEINDHAGDIYIPKPYPGMVTLFKPHINYKFYPDPKMGWEDLASGGLDIIEMPINPHAMLLEPYVEDLAEALKVRLDRLAPA